MINEYNSDITSRMLDLFTRLINYYDSINTFNHDTCMDANKFLVDCFNYYNQNKSYINDFVKGTIDGYCQSIYYAYNIISQLEEISRIDVNIDYDRFKNKCNDIVQLFYHFDSKLFPNLSNQIREEINHYNSIISMHEMKVYLDNGKDLNKINDKLPEAYLNDIDYYKRIMRENREKELNRMTNETRINNSGLNKIGGGKRFI